MPGVINTPGVQRSIGLHTIPVSTSSACCRLTIPWCQTSNRLEILHTYAKSKEVRCSSYPKRISAKQTMLHFKKTLFHFSSRFDVWHHGIVNLQQAEDLLTGIVRKPMLRWTPGFFVTPGTYHIYAFQLL